MRTALLLLSLATAMAAADSVTIPLWPDGAPEPAATKIGPEREPESKDGIRRLTDVTEPTITIRRPAQANGTLVMVCPGGGYSILAIGHEGTDVCDFLHSLGVTTALLKYRVPARDPADPGREALQDARRAIGILRHRAADLGVRPDRIGMMGFSAGGHLTVMACLSDAERGYPMNPELDVENTRPDFAIPVYPAYLVSREQPFSLLPEIKVTPNAPPLCLIHAHDDNGATSSAASALLYLEYKKLNIPAELHVYEKGGHGFGMKKTGLPAADWLQRTAEWMRARGMMEKTNPRRPAPIPANPTPVPE